MFSLSCNAPSFSYWTRNCNESCSDSSITNTKKKTSHVFTALMDGDVHMPMSNDDDNDDDGYDYQYDDSSDIMLNMHCISYCVTAFVCVFNSCHTQKNKLSLKLIWFTANTMDENVWIGYGDGDEEHDKDVQYS